MAFTAKLLQIFGEKSYRNVPKVVHVFSIRHICLPDLGHMTKMAATPIYGKKPSKPFSSEPVG